MVTVESMVLNHVNKTAKVDLFADSTAEVSSTMVVPEIPAGYAIAVGSVVRTPAFDVGTMNSEGTWSWA